MIENWVVTGFVFQTHNLSINKKKPYARVLSRKTFRLLTTSIQI